MFSAWNIQEFRAAQTGSTVTWTVRWTNIGGVAGSGTGSYTGTAGRIRTVNTWFSAAFNGAKIGHVAAFATATSTAYDGADDGYAGELAGARLARLCREEGVPITILGDVATHQAMGPQRPARLLDLLVHRSDQVDRALGEHRDQLAEHDKRLGELEQARASGEDHEPRLATVERRQWVASGAAAALGTMGGYLLDYALQ